MNDTLITVNTRHSIIPRRTLSQKSREAIIYNKSCLQVSLRIDVRLIKNKRHFSILPFFDDLDCPANNLRVR